MVTISGFGQGLGLEPRKSTKMYAFGQDLWLEPWKSLRLGQVFGLKSWLSLKIWAFGPGLGLKPYETSRIQGIGLKTFVLIEDFGFWAGPGLQPRETSWIQVSGQSPWPEQPKTKQWGSKLQVQRFYHDKVAAGARSRGPWALHCFSRSTPPFYQAPSRRFAFAIPAASIRTPHRGGRRPSLSAVSGTIRACGREARVRVGTRQWR